MHPHRTGNITRHTTTDQCLILDLDETLLHTMGEDAEDFANTILEDPKYRAHRWKYYQIVLEDIFVKRGQGTREKYWGLTRPYLADFLSFCFSHFKLVTVWSAGQRPYVHNIVDVIFRDSPYPDLVFTYDDVISTGDGYHKPIELIMEHPRVKGIMKHNNTFFLDDRYANFLTSPGNGVTIPPYKPSPTPSGLVTQDFALLQFKNWLLRPEVMESKDVRTLDKSSIFMTKLNYMFDYPVSKQPVSIKDVLIEDDMVIAGI